MQHPFDLVSAKLIRACSKSSLLNRLEEVETLAAHRSVNGELLNDLAATYVTPLIRFLYNHHS